MKHGICRYRDYTENFESDINDFMKDNEIYQENIISISTSHAYTIMWYWGELKTDIDE